MHDPIDKCFDIPTHIERAKNYAQKLAISGVEEGKGPDQIASCMERSLLAKGITQDFNEVRHPFCKGSLKIENYNKEKIFKAFEEIYKKIGKEISNLDDKKKFFYLWRNLQDRLFENLKAEPWIKYLPLLPADTRVPDHSIWEHLKIASAINAYWDGENKIFYQNNSLFLFTIGPVQSFISQARKTQDFYMGSFILSFLTFKAMEVIIDKYGPTNIIYPDLYKQPLMDFWLRKKGVEPIGFNENSIQLPTIPNRFVAILPTTDKEEITHLTNSMKDNIKETVKNAKNTIFEEFSIGPSQDTSNKIDSQLNEFPEIYWVAVPWKIDNRDISFDDLKEYFEDEVLKNYQDLWNFAGENGEFKPNIGLMYELLYSTLEKSMGARKNLREFKQIAEKGRKCSVCGERDVVFFRETDNKDKFARFNPYAIDLTDTEKVLLKYLANGEGLCAICFIKRTFEIYLEKEVSRVFGNLTFPSTAEVALADFKERALEKAREAYFAFQKIFEGISQARFPKVKPMPKLVSLFNDIGNLEGQWFYEENLTEESFREELGLKEIDGQVIKELREGLRKITERVGKPNPYYATLHLDGDNMGKWLSGELLPEIEYAYNSEVWQGLPEEFKKELKGKRTKKLLTPAIHASISTALRNYALEFVRKIVEEEHLGKLIYAGGDDVLAFVNLKDLFDVMQKLRWAFSGQIKVENGEIRIDINNQTGFVEKDGRYLLSMGPEATASMGVVIAHYKTPLQIAIGKVFEMEKKAKKECRNRFAICLMKRSGEERIATAEWKYDDKDTIDTLKEIAKSFDENNEEGYIAKGFIQKFALEFKHLKDEKGNFVGTAEIIKQELSRLLYRSFNLPKGRKISEEERRNFIKNLADKMNELFWSISGNIDYFINFCIIATFINKGGD
ncbi:type III-B CRISPR-associated protein Cas10/Cmr2 [Candidatus Kryptobacter tengchongensis]|uniref:CRISPR-associated protein Cmr2 n=1 Tax=Kryptobacter tengchongensis TaxID=1643429 RepID=A0A916LK98_KRYT1|nr:type III-B CRISPR-associated protein Cas10/Cmr2 [Candidatus Kryptobacter tengchongensis]CUT01638.1 CRISPR-associated protein Cmr2 [Candidatus Kryptobacter tengchongensis]